jgi:hypothetical protein
MMEHERRDITVGVGCEVPKFVARFARPSPDDAQDNVAVQPGSGAELGDHHELYRKMSVLRHEGLIDQGEARLCTIRHVRCVTWNSLTVGPA